MASPCMLIAERRHPPRSRRYSVLDVEPFSQLLEKAAANGLFPISKLALPTAN